MNSITHKKIEKNLFNIVSKIITEEVTDSKVSLPSVTGVQLSRDKSHLKIYLTFTSYPKQSLDALQNAKGFIRSQLSRYTEMRKVPRLYLLQDTTWEDGKKIDEILKRISKKNSD